MQRATIKIITYIVIEHDLKLVAFPNGIRQAGQETWPACEWFVFVHTQTQIYYTGYTHHKV
jgi:hypothetical protein